MTDKARGRVAAGVAGLALTVAYLGWALTELPVGRLAEPGAGVFPLVVGALLAVASAAVVIEARRQRPDTPGTDIPSPGPERRRWLVAAAALLAYPALLSLVGYLAAAFLVSAVLLRELAPVRPGWGAALLQAAALGGLAWALFARLLGVPLPSSPIGWWH